MFSVYAVVLVQERGPDGQIKSVVAALNTRYGSAVRIQQLHEPVLGPL